MFLQLVQYEQSPVYLTLFISIELQCLLACSTIANVYNFPIENIQIAFPGNVYCTLELPTGLFCFHYLAQF